VEGTALACKVFLAHWVIIFSVLSGTARWEEQHKAVNEYDGEGVSKEFLSEFSTSCWNAILLFIMGSTATQPPSDRVVSLLICGEFVTVNEYA